MARQFWTEKRLAVRIDKIKQSLTVPAASYTCNFIRKALFTPTNISPIRLNSNITLSNTQLTIDFWAKFLQNPGVPSGTYYDAMSLIESGAVGQIRLKLETANTRCVITTSLGTYTINVARSYFYEWHRFTITFSVTDNELRLYVDTVLVGSVATTGNLINNTFSFNFGQALFLGQAIGFFNELALYSTRKTHEAIIQTNSFKANIGEYGTTLQGYWKLNNLVGGVSSPSVGVIDVISSAATLDDNEHAPIKFGSSFVVAQFDITLTHKLSLQFPEVPPDGTTGMLVVRWEDDEDVIQRRRLWDLDGVDIAPMPATYNGEAIGEVFTLELWNIDELDTCVLPEDITLHISKTTNPTSSHDSSSIEAATLTADSTLAEAFPLTIPATFNSQQTYP